MPSTDRPASTCRVRLLSFALVLAATGACAKSDTAADSLAAGTNAPATTAAAMGGDSAMGGHDMSSMPGMAMTGDPDRDFLRMMSDHHKGLILMTDLTKDRKDGGPVIADATKMEAKQDQELDHMVSMLAKDFKDPYTPKVMPQHQAMTDALKSKTGKEYDRAFYQNVIQHHQEAVKMVDDYLPKLKNTMLRQMAETMKADQAKEIADFRQKVSRLGA